MASEDIDITFLSSITLRLRDTPTPTGSNISNIDVYQDIDLLFLFTHPGREALHTPYSEGHHLPGSDGYHLDSSMDFAMQPCIQSMAQAKVRYLIHKRPVTQNYHLPGIDLDHLGFHARPLSSSPTVEGSDCSEYQSGSLFPDGSRSAVSMFFPLFLPRS